MLLRFLREFSALFSLVLLSLERQVVPAGQDVCSSPSRTLAELEGPHLTLAPGHPPTPQCPPAPFLSKQNTPFATRLALICSQCPCPHCLENLSPRSPSRPFWPCTHTSCSWTCSSGMKRPFSLFRLPPLLLPVRMLYLKFFNSGRPPGLLTRRNKFRTIWSGQPLSSSNLHAIYKAIHFSGEIKSTFVYTYNGILSKMTLCFPLIRTSCEHWAYVP